MEHQYIDYTKESVLLHENDTIRIVQNIEDVIDALNCDETVARFEYGESMVPIFESSEYAILKPIDIRDVKVGDAVLCKVHGSWMTHMVWIVNRHTHQCLIGSSNGDLYGWTDTVVALATRVSPRAFQRNS